MSVKHGGLGVSSLFFGFVSSIPLMLIAADRPNVEPRRKERRQALLFGVGGALSLIALYVYGQFLIFPTVSIIIALTVVVVVLLGIPLFLQSRLTHDSRMTE
jgi:drug/metabolite transporter (DMT)-like permease